MPFEIVTIVILILSVVLHEVAHGYAANWLGDPTARLAGRLSANPLLHIDPVGSVLIPVMLHISGSPFLFGWANPSPTIRIIYGISAGEKPSFLQQVRLLTYFLRLFLQ